MELQERKKELILLEEDLNRLKRETDSLDRAFPFNRSIMLPVSIFFIILGMLFGASAYVTLQTVKASSFGLVIFLSVIFLIAGVKILRFELANRKLKRLLQNATERIEILIENINKDSNQI